MYRELLEFLENAGNPLIGVVGDLMLDRYLWGVAERMSPEAPVPVVQIDHTKTYTTVGGAGSVMRDLAALGARVWAAGVVGEDASGREIIEKLEGDGIDTALVIRDKGRATTIKTRVLSRAQHLFRIDEEEKRPLDDTQVKELVERIRERLRQTEVVILSDYDKGVLRADVMAAVTEAARDAGKPVWADPARGRHFADFSGVTVITPNRKETEEATGLAIPSGMLPEKAAVGLLENLGIEAAVITLDTEGIYYMTASGEGELIPARPRAAYDVTGAGDMVVAAATFAVACGRGLRTALAFANFAAGMEVEKIGVQPIERREFLRRLKAEAHLASEKIVEQGELPALLDNHRRRGEKIVFTNGCFDIMHPGHVNFLEFARGQGDLLVVGLNSDKSVRSIKGEGRPICTEEERGTVLAALEAVDYVVIFDEDTPAALINTVGPDILVKGEDWREKGVVGRESVEGRGGRVVLAPLVPGVSTSGVVERIVKKYSGGAERE